MNTQTIDVSKINFDKLNGLVPACIQDADTMQVLMVGFMNQEALQQTLASKRVTFYSRTKQRLWTKGETSGHFLEMEQLCLDCDNDTLLIIVKRSGPACHTGAVSCFTQAMPALYWLGFLNQVIRNRVQTQQEGYTKQLLDAGMPRMAQKVGEEAVEVVISALSQKTEEIAGEVVDLLYHVFVLLCAKQISIERIATIIQERSTS
ncbi:MAG: bifunctional phosphoribosyl-AMP cyclohydrolase/phosphoribosyl-ATP diphosphatase HisIE [Gammaproteobacteria bacterium]|nr:bifunctional phosphoribosyl-AMP cyclohydrolase/phosphoribosyl-ATP diphosphatase HisIE [Gammaproteobacteria bacterium]